MALYIVKPWYKKEEPPIPALIYGAEWSGDSSPVWMRTDAAANFADPNPYYAGMSGTPGSPFDNIMPWAGMRRVTDASAGELVEIPKYYYKWTRDGVKMKLQISMSQFDGSHVSPAHADRGDGVGERDYVYVGRYHCSTNDYKSTSGVLPINRITRTTARNAIHNLAVNIWQLDFAMWWTINMLYLVEYANWDVQTSIAYGCGNNSSVQNSGSTDNMNYHSGTISTSRSTYGVGVQYRYIEDWWANVCDWCDGIYFSGANVYCIKNPADFSDSTGGVNVGQRGTTNSDGYIKAWLTPSASGYEYALYPSDNSASSGYISDYCYYSASGNVLDVNAYYSRHQAFGSFSMFGQDISSTTDSRIGARLMVLPPSRLSA